MKPVITRKHIMVDIETLDRVPTAIILEIGAVEFDPSNGALGDRFHVIIDRRTQPERTINPETVAWWRGQKNFEKATSGTVSLRQALQMFEDWYVKTVGENEESVAVWCEGEHFDIAILSHAYGYNPPWGYRAPRDTRTALEMACTTKEGYDAGRESMEHDALEDALHQARYVSDLFLQIHTIRSNRF